MTRAKGKTQAKQQLTARYHIWTSTSNRSTRVTLRDDGFPTPLHEHHKEVHPGLYEDTTYQPHPAHKFATNDPDKAFGVAADLTKRLLDDAKQRVEWLEQDLVDFKANRYPV